MNDLMKGQRVRITSITAPQGRVVGSVERKVEPEGWYSVQFPTCEKPLEVHRSMLEPVRI